MPIIPHLSNECYEKLYEKQFELEVGWPEIKKNLLLEKSCNIVIQVNGKKRGILELPVNSDEIEIANQAKNIINVKKNIENKNIQKQIYIKNRLLNFITK